MKNVWKYLIILTLLITVFPVSVAAKEPLFLDEEENYNKLYDLNESYNFEEIDEWLSEHSEDPMNQTILDILSPIKPYFAHLNREHDEIEDKLIITYDDQTEITEDIHALATFDDTVMTQVGFIKDDWLFFNEVVLKADDHEPEFFKAKSATNVLDNGQICEKSYLPGIETLRALDEAPDQITLRFKGQDDQLDIELSEVEINNLFTMEHFHPIQVEIANIAFWFKNKADYVEYIEENPIDQAEIFFDDESRVIVIEPNKDALDLLKDYSFFAGYSKDMYNATDGMPKLQIRDLDGQPVFEAISGHAIKVEGN